jgi:hypothetical protein
VDLFEDTGMRGLANKLGLNYVGFSRDDGYRAETGGLPNLPLLTDIGERDVTDLMYGRLGGANAQLFNVVIPAYEPDPRRPDRSCVAITFAANFPRISIGPHTRMSRLRQRTAWKRVRGLSDDFKDRFSIDTSDPDALPKVFDGPIVSFLLAQSDDLRIELQGGAMLGHVPKVDEDHFPEFVEIVRGVHQRIPQDAWAEYSMFRL